MPIGTYRKHSKIFSSSRTVIIDFKFRAIAEEFISFQNSSLINVQL